MKVLSESNNVKFILFEKKDVGNHDPCYCMGAFCQCLINVVRHQVLNWCTFFSGEKNNKYLGEFMSLNIRSNKVCEISSCKILGKKPMFDISCRIFLIMTPGLSYAKVIHKLSLYCALIRKINNYHNVIKICLYIEKSIMYPLVKSKCHYHNLS